MYYKVIDEKNVSTFPAQKHIDLCLIMIYESHPSLVWRVLDGWAKQDRTKQQHGVQLGNTGTWQSVR